MQESVFIGGHIVTSGGAVDGWLHTRDGRIAGIGTGTPPSVPAIDVGGRWIGPGMIDLHVHGGDGADVNNGGPDDVPHLARFLASRGITSFLPSISTMDTDDTLHALEHVAAHLGPIPGGATVLGAHMEGPYLSTARKGAHRAELIRELDWAECERFLALGVVKLMAVAPEVGDHMAQIPRLRERGVVVAAGHTDATDAQLREAIAQGVTQVTHLFNGMRGIHHREAGTAGGALASPDVRCEVIADGVHVDRRVLELIWRAKGVDGIVLISDAVKAAGLPDGQYERGGRTVTAAHGVMRLDDGTISGSLGSVSEGFRIFCEANRLDFAEAWPVASTNAARAIGVDDRKGRIAEGWDADLTILDDDGSVAMTVVAGEPVHSAF